TEFCFISTYTVTFWYLFFFSSRRRHTRFSRDWSSDVCSSDLSQLVVAADRFAADEDLRGDLLAGHDLQPALRGVVVFDVLRIERVVALAQQVERGASIRTPALVEDLDRGRVEVGRLLDRARRGGSRVLVFGRKDAALDLVLAQLLAVRFPHRPIRVR